MFPATLSSGFSSIATFRTVSITGVLYLTPKILQNLCQESNEQPLSQVGRVRKLFASFSESLQSTLGERKWFVITKVITENAWISFLVLSYLTKGAPLFMTFSRGLDEAGAFFGFCSISWLARDGAIQIWERGGH
ncbi:MAG: hypothetical protein COT85_07930 [Chlamydiae bacterium CG10_big_fil_rev_8_21_14_0_10_42_34]|nr:MAG: hypothetical protein COT85_07930 [Chlamydiae bacterium CG10_big_fil_rev_8_21_14_0_10_42_34]